MKEAFERLKFRKKNQRFDFTKFKTVKLLHRFAGKQVAACSPTFHGLLSIRVESFSEQSVSRALFKFEGRNCRDKLVREEALFETKQRDYNCFSNTRMSKILIFLFLARIPSRLIREEVEMETFEYPQEYRVRSRAGVKGHTKEEGLFTRIWTVLELTLYCFDDY